MLPYSIEFTPVKTRTSETMKHIISGILDNLVIILVPYKGKGTGKDCTMAVLNPEIILTNNE